MGVDLPSNACCTLLFNDWVWIREVGPAAEAEAEADEGAAPDDGGFEVRLISIPCLTY